MEVLKKNQLHLNKKKCIFGQEEVEYLGHIISHKGVAADEVKVKAMVEWPSSGSLRELHEFLGLIEYYRRFVKDNGKIASSLTESLKKNNFRWDKEAERAFQELKGRMMSYQIAWSLTKSLKKNNFHWDKEAKRAFQELKGRMMSLPALGLPDFTKTFVVKTDALGYGLGVVLMQECRPIAFFSQAINQKGQEKSVYERELMASLRSTKVAPLLGHHFIIRTDQKSLKFLLVQRVVTPEY